MERNLISIFEDTLKHSETIKSKYETLKFTFSDIYKIPSNFCSDTKGYNNVVVENLDTVSAAIKYSKIGKTCILNMASYKRPGGGVERGARAQEECLFRCSNLWNCIDSSNYPLRQNECLYTKNSTFFKDKDYNYMDPINLDVVTIAAININEIQHYFGDRIAKYEELKKILDYENITKDKIRLMLTLGIKNGVSNLILGAWGCGVFKNDPKRMAIFFKEVLSEGYASRFKNVVFAVINDHNSVGNNFDIFQEELN